MIHDEGYYLLLGRPKQQQRLREKIDKVFVVDTDRPGLLLHTRTLSITREHSTATHFLLVVFFFEM